MKNSGKKPEIVRKLMFWVCVLVFVCSSVYLLKYCLNTEKTKKTYDSVESLYKSVTDETEIVTEPVETEKSTEKATQKTAENSVTTQKTEPPKIPLRMLNGAKLLLEENPETVGYIEIADTEMSYPVVQKTDKIEGNQYYLTHDFNDVYTTNGCVFMDKSNVFDKAIDEYTLAENSDNIVLYGHNLKSGLLFGTLRPYKKDFDFYKEHSVINFNSNYKTYRYKIFAVCVVDTNKESDVLGDAHSRHNFENNADFKQFVADCKERSQYDTGVNVRDNASLLTLSTCTSWEGSSLRMIVVAALEEYTY